MSCFWINKQNKRNERLYKQDDHVDWLGLIYHHQINKNQDKLNKRLSKIAPRRHIEKEMMEDLNEISIELDTTVDELMEFLGVDD